jgi:hypothetical protein
MEKSHFWIATSCSKIASSFSAMTTEQRDTIIKVLRDYIRTCADYRALVAILDSEQKNERVSEDWQADLHDIQQTEEYRKILEGFEPMMASIERAMGEDRSLDFVAKKPLRIVER